MVNYQRSKVGFDPEPFSTHLLTLATVDADDDSGETIMEDAHIVHDRVSEHPQR